MKITLNQVTNGNMLSTINANFDKLEEELQSKVLYRDNPSDEPNEMITDLDMNGRRVFNLPPPLDLNEAARLQDVQDAISGLPTAALVPFSPTTEIASTNVQGAINETYTELNANKVNVLDLSNNLNPSLGDALVGVKRTAVGTSAQTLHSWIEKQVLSITDFFGAVADSGVTDNATAINAACAAARAIGTGAAVYIPAQSGYFGVASSIDVSGVHMFGDGDQSIIRANSAQFNVLTTTGQTRLNHFQIHGGWDGVTAGLSGDSLVINAVSPAFPYDVHIDSLRILNSKRRGIYIERGGYTSITRVKCNASGLHGLELFGPSGADAVTTVKVDGSSVFSDTPNGRSVKITNGINITLDSVISENTQGYELAGADNRNIAINHCYQEVTTGGFVTFTGSGVGLEMYGNFGIGLTLTPSSNWDRTIIGGNNTFDLTAGVLPAGWKILRGSSIKVVTGSETTTSTTGGVNFTACQFDLPQGIWQIQASLQTINSVGATLVTAGFRLTNNASDNVSGVTGAGFVADEVLTGPYNAATAAARPSMTQIYENTTAANQTFYMRGFINISAGTIAYKGFMRAVRIG